MKKIYFLFILLHMGVVWGLVAQEVTKVSKPILPLSSVLPVVYEDNVRGGYHQVADLAERTALASALKEVGMLVWQQDTHATYQWDGTTWRKVQLVRTWEVGSEFFIGDIFLYNNTSLVIAKTNGTISAIANPLTDTINWTSILGATLASGEILIGNASNVATSSAATALSIDGDVSGTLGVSSVDKLKGTPLTIGSLVAGDVVRFNGTTWENSTLSNLGFITLVNGTAGDDVAFTGSPLSLGGTLTLNVPDASASARGVVSKVAQTFAGAKTFSNDVTMTGDLALNGGDMTTNSATATLFNTIATTLNIGGASNNTTIGSVTGMATTTIANNLKIGNPSVDKITMNGGDLMVAGDAEIDGTLWAKDLQTSSDKRLKTDIKTLSNVLAKLEQIRGVSYKFKDQKKYAEGSQVGVIAQELQSVYPELVAQGIDGYLTVNYPQLTAVLLQAVKEQQLQLDKQQQQINSLFKLLGQQPER